MGYAGAHDRTVGRTSVTALGVLDYCRRLRHTIDRFCCSLDSSGYHRDHHAYPSSLCVAYSRTSYRRVQDEETRADIQQADRCSTLRSVRLTVSHKVNRSVRLWE